MEKGLFEKYANAVRKSAHFYAKKYSIEYEEVESQGFLIYCQALEKFDCSKSQFITYLIWRLKALNKYCKQYKRHSGSFIDDLKVEDKDFEYKYLQALNDGTTLKNMLEVGLNNLSAEAFKVYKWILERSWERKGIKKPSIALASNVFNYNRNYTQEIWNEIKNFYCNNLQLSPII